MTTPAVDAPADHARWLGPVGPLVDAVDQRIYDAVAGSPTPQLDRLLVTVSNAANQSRLWLGAAAALAVVGGRPGRRAAGQGVLAIALTSAVTNLLLKPVSGRPRPVRSDGQRTPDSRRVRQPASRSFPSGHAASAFAFASAVGRAAPRTRLPLRLTAASVAYSRVHTGVHYPSDVIVGAMIGELCGRAVWRGPPPPGAPGGGAAAPPPPRGAGAPRAVV
jgi:membrane-associated phospholipid phosphatase